jgi:hypothetical protein
MTKDGGPAFPLDVNNEVEGTTHYGMSLRDWFAGEALNGWLTGWGALGTFDVSPEMDMNQAAGFAYHMADIMLEERVKKLKEDDR